MFVEQCPCAFEEKRWKAVEVLAEKPWLTRVWVYQEFVVSKGVLFICGLDSMDNETFRSARSAWGTFPSSEAASKARPGQVVTVLSTETRPVDGLDWQRFVYEVRRAETQRNISCDNLPCLDLLALLGLTRLMKATNPKGQAIRSFKPSMMSGILPSYQITPSQSPKSSQTLQSIISRQGRALRS